MQNSIGISLDDSFSTKTWDAGTDLTLNYPGPAQPLYNVTFQNNLAWTHCYGFKVGQGAMQEQRTIRFYGGTVYDAAVGLGIHHKVRIPCLVDDAANSTLRIRFSGVQHLSAIFGSMITPSKTCTERMMDIKPGSLSMSKKVTLASLALFRMSASGKLVCGIVGSRQRWRTELRRKGVR